MSPCDHAELLWGHCTDCGMPWSQQALEAVVAIEAMLGPGAVTSRPYTLVYTSCTDTDKEAATMAVQLKGQSGWDDKAKAAREAEAQALYDTHKLRTDDTVRFPKMPGLSTWIIGLPKSVNTDGSINVWCGKVRAIRPEAIEVKMQGPRGGFNWEPLVPKAGE